MIGRSKTNFMIHQKYLLSGSDDAGGTYICACAAVNAGFGVDGVDFAFADRGGGTFIDAGAAGNAIVGDDVGHGIRILEYGVVMSYANVRQTFQCAKFFGVFFSAVSFGRMGTQSCPTRAASHSRRRTRPGSRLPPA